MRPRRILAPRDATEIFDYAVQERALAVLTVQEGSDWRTFKSRFLERDASARFFVLDYQPVDGEGLPPIAPGQYVGVTFRQRSRKVLFATVVEAKGHFVLDDRSTVPAVRYRWPDSMTELQRRAYYRTPVPEGTTLLVSLWPGGSAARSSAQASTLQVSTGDLADISCGGALVRLHQATPAPWLDGEVLGIQMQLPDGRPPVVIDARFRGVRHDALGARSAALQFVGLEMTVDGRLVLQRLAGSLQRLHRENMVPGPRGWNPKPSP
jgi:c-di-GMP-binding flagellar brake protein YcgR